MSNQVILKTDIPGLNLIKRGKVRDIFEIDKNLLIVSTDRISAFDVVFPNGIPLKGKILNQLSAFWFNKLTHIIPNHFITADITSLKIIENNEILSGRTMLVKKAQPLLIEAIVRGYLTGSALIDYNKFGSVCGIKLPSGLIESSKLPEPIFTPSIKAETGHDANISEIEAIKLLGDALYQKIKDISLKLYNEISTYVYDRGLIFADTKFEFGISDGELILIDEVGTPDSSRYWDLKNYREGVTQPSYDKQYVREYLIKIGWDKNPPAPELPEEIINGTRDRYLNAYKMIVGEDLKL